MRAITPRSGASREPLRTNEVPDPVAGPSDALIDVAAAGVNRADLLQRSGHYPPPPGASPILGLEVAGVVAALGDRVTGWSVGDRVAALLTGGGYAERVVVPATQIHPVPAAMELVDAAAVPEAAATAWSALISIGGLQAGQVALVHGGSGGIGTFALQLAKAVGATVLTTAGGPARAHRCYELGADVAIDHRREDFVTRVLEETDGRGADVVLDLLGGGALEQNLAAVAVDGRVVVIGLQQGTRAELDLAALLAKRVSIIGTTLRSRPDADRAAIVAAVTEQVWPMVADGRIHPVIHARLPLEEAERAHEMLRSGETFGKVLLIP